MKLVIIESPFKREALKKYLGSGYEVFATKGHIRDLPTKGLAVDIKNNFEPKYEIVPDKKELIEDLRKKANSAEEVYIATDPDREGEAISWHVANILGFDKDKNCRIEFNEISKKAVTKALEHPRQIDLKLVNAQQARRVLDRLVGYKLSPILCKKIAPKLSAGRVQSVALKLVVDREREIENFVPEEYWLVNAHLKKSTSQIKALLSTYKNKKYQPKSKEEVDKILEECKDKPFTVTQIKKSKTKSHAPAPFTTSTMQQDALNKLGLSLARTTASAQQLYEGVEIQGEGKIALITYIRTDSVRVSQDAQNACLDFIRNKYGSEYLPSKPNIYTSKQNAQDAHEAIRPITMDITPEMAKPTLSADNYKLYKLIYERFLASQMAEVEYSNVSVNIDCKDYGFKVSGRTMEFPGYTAVYKEYVEKDKEDGLAGKLPKLDEGEQLPCEKITTEQKFTKPPARYTEASLVKSMEEKGIGRPATYASTITVINSRKYTQKEGKYLYPTELGRKINDYLEKFFSGVINVKFTAHMEQRLDDIASKGEDWHSVVSSFYNGFDKLLERADASSVTMKEPPKETDIICDKCGGKMVIRSGRFGQFLACSNFPKCKNTRPIETQVKKVGVCPECHSSMVERKSKKGKIFYSCERYPDCKFMSWDIPTGERCPKCNSPLVHKGKRIVCSSNECDYKLDN